MMIPEAVGLGPEAKTVQKLTEKGIKALENVGEKEVAKGAEKEGEEESKTLTQKAKDKAKNAVSAVNDATNKAVDKVVDVTKKGVDAAKNTADQVANHLGGGGYQYAADGVAGDASRAVREGENVAKDTTVVESRKAGGNNKNRGKNTGEETSKQPEQTKTQEDEIKGEGENNPNTEETENKKDVFKRFSKFRKKILQMVWDKAKDGPEPGTKSCPTCGKTVRVPPGTKGVKRDWDIDHIIPWKRIVDAWRGIAKDKPPGRKEVGNRYNDSNNLRLECPSCNRARGASVRGTSSVGRKK